MKRLCGIILLLAMGSAIQSHCDVMDYAYGRSGTALKNAFRIHCAPEIYKDQSNEIIISINSAFDGMAKDGISKKPLDPSQATVALIVPAEWMQLSSLESSRISMDLYNLILTDPLISIDRKTYPFATVSQVTKQHENVAVGYSTFRGDLIEAVDPHPELKGDIARSIFYVTTLYPVSMWTDWGGFFFENNPYPTLTQEAADLYLKWHREDPVDEEEFARCKAIAAIQGNENPFVTHPEIAEYIWGDKKGEVYGSSSQSGSESGSESDSDSDSNSDPESETGATPQTNQLKPVYSKQTDKTITLQTPYLPSDTQWWMDNKKVSGEISTASLPEGKHELRFKNSTSQGKLIITIRQ